MRAREARVGAWMRSVRLNVRAGAGRSCYAIRSQVHTHTVGLALLKGDFERACKCATVRTMAWLGTGPRALAHRCATL